MKFPSLKFSSSLSPLPFGLDISDLYLRLVQLRKKRGNNFSLRTYHELPLPDGIIQEGEIIKKDQLVRMIKKIMTETPGEKINSKEVITALPEPKTFIKYVTLQWPQKKDETLVKKKRKRANLKAKETILEETIIKELKEDIPLPLEEAAIDYQIINGNLEKIQPGDKLENLVGIAPKKIADDYTQILEASGLTPVALEIEGVAIARALINNNPNEEEKVKIIIDLGATRTGLMVYFNNLVRYSLSIPVSGRQITQRITETMKVSFNEAEKLKLTCHLDSQKGQDICQIITPVLEDIIDRIQEALCFCQQKINLTKKEKLEIIICGGGANWPGLSQFLNKRLNLNVKIADPWINFKQPPKNLPLRKALSYTTAIGLALRGLYDYS